eukprot:GHVU01040622.1.p1 GENE.GHVU01040622.1~~GHVU01040622.1.p1  ORF type:complete len:146 (+),score=9.13 GHVU01040622.1:139-576(+)
MKSGGQEVDSRMIRWVFVGMSMVALHALFFGCQVPLAYGEERALRGFDPPSFDLVESNMAIIHELASNMTEGRTTDLAEERVLVPSSLINYAPLGCNGTYWECKVRIQEVQLRQWENFGNAIRSGKGTTNQRLQALIQAGLLESL